MSWWAGIHHRALAASPSADSAVMTWAASAAGDRSGAAASFVGADAGAVGPGAAGVIEVDVAAGVAVLVLVDSDPARGDEVGHVHHIRQEVGDRGFGGCPVRCGRDGRMHHTGRQAQGCVLMMVIQRLLRCGGWANTADF